MRKMVVAGLLASALSAPAFADEYHYQPGLHADPFRAPEALPAPVDRCGDDALCKLDVQDLKVTAIVTGEAKPLAMVEDGKGGSYILHRGQNIGRGRVEEIRSDRVVIVETRESDNGPVKVTRELKIN